MDGLMRGAETMAHGMLVIMKRHGLTPLQVYRRPMVKQAFRYFKDVLLPKEKK